MHGKRSGPEEGPLEIRIAAMASSRESWRLVNAYICQQHPAQHRTGRRSPSASLLRLFRRVKGRPHLPAGLPVIRPAD